MRNSILVRSIAAVSGIVMLASVAACGDNTTASTDSSAKSDTKTQTVSGNFSGAGASSQQTAVEAWIAGFQGTNPEAKIAYNPSGSGAGVSTFLTGATAWAGSDASLADNEVEQSKSVCASGTAFDIPVYISPIAVVFNLQGVSGKGKTLNMDAETIAKIFDGKITKWNDDAIKKQNPKVDLPDLDITVVHRSDKSGTTKNFLSYVKDAAGDAWSYDLGENWPNEVGQGAKGTSGVISTAQQADGTIGYADASQAGDLGTVDEDGYYRVTGRIKDMIIRGGENIYPKEIEEFIYTHPAVKDVQVIGVPDKKYGEEAMACIILKEPGSVTVEEMLDYIKASMARHKVPKYIDFVDAFPMNAAGKILKYKMREEATERFGLEGAAGIDTAQTAEQVKR